ncbi:MAG: hypothetical protein JST80_09840 [Bdellovibrionales bacterium]|nr:hypothetical protein [Bdellovibrionales bacterium]
MKNSKVVKTIVLALTLTFAASIATPPKANAGIVFYAVGRTNTDMNDDARHTFQVLGIIFFVGGLFGWGPGWIVLDANTASNYVSNMLKSKYTALATQPAIADELATALTQEGNKQFKANEGVNKVEVKLPADVVAKILRKAIKNDDNRASFEQLAIDLQ